jgi:hypothetical protein
MNNYQLFFKMNIKKNIIFSPESRCKNGKVKTENISIRMRVMYGGHRIDFSTGYRIDVAKWDEDKQRVKNGCTNKIKQKQLRKSMPTFKILYCTAKISFRLRY